MTAILVNKLVKQCCICLDLVLNTSYLKHRNMALDPSKLFSAVLIFQALWNFENVHTLRLLELQVPSLVDIRENMTLGCVFDMGGEKLNSVKWYKEENEFFRYRPHSQPHMMSFPVAGVHVIPDSGECDTRHCIVRLTRLSTAHSSGWYRCEVSTDAPTFHVAFDTANVTVAALARHDPVVDGVQSAYDPGDLVVANCTSAPADPAPLLQWLVNGEPAPGISVGQPRTSRPDQMGLVTRSLLLRFPVEKHHFPEPGGLLQLQCVATVPGIPGAHVRDTTVTAHMRSMARSVLSNQKLEWLNGGNDGVFAGSYWTFIVTVLLSLWW